MALSDPRQRSHTDAGTQRTASRYSDSDPRTTRERRDMTDKHQDLARTAFYDPENQALWVARRFFQPKSRVSKDEVMHWTKILKEGGTTDDGRPIEAVNYLFVDEESAAYNYQTLSFANIGVYYKEGGNRIEYVPDDETDFQVRKDFGVKTKPGEGGIPDDA